MALKIGWVNSKGLMSKVPVVIIGCPLTNNNKKKNRVHRNEKWVDENGCQRYYFLVVESSVIQGECRDIFKM